MKYSISENGGFLNTDHYVLTGYHDLDKQLMLKQGEVIGVAGVAGIGVESLLKNIALKLFTKGKRIAWAGNEDIISELIMLDAEVGEKNALFGMDGLETQRVVGSIACNFLEDGKHYIHQIQQSKAWEWNQFGGYNQDYPKIIFIPNLLDCVAKETDKKKSLQDKVSDILININAYSREYNTTIFIGIPLAMNNSPTHDATLRDLNNDNRDYIKMCDQVIRLHRREYYDRLDKPGYAEIGFFKSRNFAESVLLQYIKELKLFLPFVPMTSEIDSELLSMASELAFIDFEA
tara:strand:+ start:1160 stop:2029 length:870 start_codon:yes stop_codon:yes gene_type:complete